MRINIGSDGNNVMKLLDQIKLMTSLTPSEQSLRAYIIQNGKAMIELDEEAFKKATFLSSSTIYRFCHKLGVKRYDDLRLRLAQEYIKSEKSYAVDYNFPFTATDSYMDISKNLLAIYTESLELTQHAIDAQELDQAIQILKKAKKICFFTSNMNTQMAEKFNAQLKEIGKDVKISSSLYKWKLEAITLTSEDALIINSYAGYSSKQFITILPELKKRGVSIIMITSTHNKSLMPYATSKLLMCDKEHPNDKLYSFSSNIATMYILDLLYIGLYQEHYDENFAKHQYIYSS